MSDYFPAFLDLRGRPCVVVGGGAIGERKVDDLLGAGARVTLVSPALTPRLAALTAAGLLTHRRRLFRRADVRGAALVIAATGVPAVDAAVAAEARRRRALVNVVDRPAECDFILPSVLRRGGLQIAVSTGGRSPALAREIRRRLERVIGPEYAALVERVGRARDQARAVAVGARERFAAGELVVAAALSELSPFGAD
ncbi:MAG TPA: bifunctional precorrin-2 dehydrogenase/sirohydrochlorin ferrochelatase [Methylomirabilota bacterium]|nr:bifunctional precorrin-2 dehydrogenase/sirohydrochlorin ferrochelatase [Methylomirabilota bacterium]